MVEQDVFQLTLHRDGIERLTAHQIERIQGIHNDVEQFSLQIGELLNFFWCCWLPAVVVTSALKAIELAKNLYSGRS